MSSELENLQATLRKLHAELESLEDGDAEPRELLVESLAVIQRVLKTRGGGELGEPTDVGPGEDSILGSLKKSAQHFEDSHPTLSGMISSVINALAQLGI